MGMCKSGRTKRAVYCGMRNILIREYFGVDVKIVWHTEKKSLPSLRKQLKKLPQETKKKS